MSKVGSLGSPSQEFFRLLKVSNIPKSIHSCDVNQRVTNSADAVACIVYKLIGITRSIK